MKAVNILKEVRAITHKIIEPLTDEQLLMIPDKYRNNILWNIGHLVVTQQLLQYKLSGNDMYISQQMCDDFKKGSSPSEWSSDQDIQEIKRLLLELPNKLADDYSAGKFTRYKGYTSSTGVSLNDIDDAVIFNNFHEGLHLGIVMSLKKHIS